MNETKKILVASSDLTEMQISHAQAGCFGAGWTVDDDGHGFDDEQLSIPEVA